MMESEYEDGIRMGVQISDHSVSSEETSKGEDSMDTPDPGEESQLKITLINVLNNVLVLLKKKIHINGIPRKRSRPKSKSLISHPALKVITILKNQNYTFCE